jgi:hypothetical protein
MVVRRQHHVLGSSTSYLAQAHELIQSSAGIFTAQPIELDPPLTTKLPICRHELTDRDAFAADLDDVPN